MNKHLDTILHSLKHSIRNTQQLDQIFAQTITTGVIHSTRRLNCMIKGYSKSPTPIKAILIYNHFSKTSSIPHDNHTFPALLKASTHLLSLSKGKEIHAHVTKIGLGYNIYIQNCLVHLYGSTGQVKDAHSLFNEIPQRDLASWNSLIATYSASHNSRNEAFVLFNAMVFDGVGADEITLVILLSGCAQVRMKEYGRSIHSYVIKVGIRCTLNLENALLDAYAKGSDMNSAFQLFQEMVGRRDAVSQTILINGYVELGLVDQAREIFDQMDVKDLVSWSSMIHGYVKANHPKEAIVLFKKMEMEMIRSNEMTIVSVLSACASLSDLQFGRLVHRFILRRNIRLELFIGTALIDMYAKCGSLEEAMLAFYKMGCKDVYTWTAVIAGLANNGKGKEALRFFEKMEKEGVQPNKATFVVVLMACSRSGLVKEGCLLFQRMVDVYKIQPKTEHFGCLTDLLCRAGLLFHAEKFIRTMPAHERLKAYKTLLSACISYFDIDLGEKVAMKLISLSPQSHRVLLLLSNFYALAEKWDKVVEMRRIMKELNMRKEAGISSSYTDLET